MRNLKKNKQTMYYALLNKTHPVYERDELGNIIYIEIDGVQVPVETGDTELVYSKPVKFKGNISTSGGESKETEYGIDSTDYDAVLMMMKNDLPITETSIIWHTSNIGYKDADKTIIDDKSADYVVKKRSPSLNQFKYLLGKVLQHKDYFTEDEETNLAYLGDEDNKILLDEQDKAIMA